MSASDVDPHQLGEEAFLEEVQSFEFWFQSVEGYLSGSQYGYDPDTVESQLDAGVRDRLVTTLCNYCVAETAALEGGERPGLVGAKPQRKNLHGHPGGRRSPPPGGVPASPR